VAPKAPQSSPEGHWHQVVRQLQLTPEQRQTLLRALQQFR
jgi:hypothetical protein